MDMVQNILLHTMWVVHLFFQRLLSNQRNKLTHSLPESLENEKNITQASSAIEKAIKPQRLPKDIIDFETKLQRRSARDAQPIRHFLFDEKKSSLVDLSDVVSPHEEEMLRCLCAKGFETRRHPATYHIRLTKACSEMCIPRDIFTNVWLNSYLTDSSHL